MIRKTVLALIAASVLTLAGTASAYADPAFGPGNEGGGVGNSQPADGKCHPPGQTEAVPGCK
jgi:hypothetical protein